MSVFGRLVGRVCDAPFELLAVLGARAEARERAQVEKVAARIARCDLQSDLDEFKRNNHG